MSTVGGRIFWRGRHAWIEYRVDGVPQRESVADVLHLPKGTATEKDAKAALEQRRREVYTDTYIETAHKKLTVADCLKELETHFVLSGAKSGQQLKSLLKIITEAVGHVRAVDMTTARLARVAREWKDAGLAPATIKGRVHYIAQAMRIAVEQRRLSPNAVPKVPKIKIDNARMGFYTPEQADDIRSHMREADQHVFDFGRLTGWRPSEILALTWDRVDRAAGEIRLDQTKNAERRGLPLIGELAALIETRWKARALGVPEVFHLYGRRLNGSSFRRRFRRARREAGHPERIFYDLRRTAARDLRRSGVSEEVAMKITGHKDRNVFRRYNITVYDDVAQAMERMQAYRDRGQNADIRPREQATGESGA